MKTGKGFELVTFLLDYLRLNRKWIFPFVIFTLLWRIAFFFTSLSNDLTLGFVQNTTLLFAFLGPLLGSSIFFSVGVGISFKPKGSESWLSRLPISTVVFAVSPYVLIAVYSCFLFIVYPTAWSYFNELGGTPLVFILGVSPLSSFLAARSIRNSSSGIIYGILLGFLTVACGVLSIHLLIEKFGLGFGRSEFFDLSFLRLEFETLCFLFILGLIFTAGSSWRATLPLVLPGLLISAFFCTVHFLNFQKKKKAAEVFLSPLEILSATCKKERDQNEPFFTFVQAYVDNRHKEPFPTRDLTLKAVEMLHQYSENPINLKSVKPFYETVEPGIAEVLLVVKTFSIKRCDSLSKSALQNVLIETITQKPDLLSKDETRIVVGTIRESLRQSLVISPSVIDSVVNLETLILLIEQGFIADHYKLEALELKRKFSDESNKLAQLNLNIKVMSFLMPSPDRIHKIFEMMQSEIVLAESMRDQLTSFISKN